VGWRFAVAHQIPDDDDDSVLLLGYKALTASETATSSWRTRSRFGLPQDRPLKRQLGLCTLTTHPRVVSYPIHRASISQHPGTPNEAKAASPFHAQTAVAVHCRKRFESVDAGIERKEKTGM
jgi:hypothetical protein